MSTIAQPIAYPIIINRNLWHTCQICNHDIKFLAELYGGTGIYYTQVFSKHLKKDHNYTILEYFSKLITIPKCVCGCGKDSRINSPKGADFKISQPCGRYKETMEWSNNARENRKGSNNPMYQATPWNKGKTFSDETKLKMRASALKRIERGDFKFTDTKPHLIMCSILDEMNIKYVKEKVLGHFAFDIYLLDYNTCIEVDGDFFHCNPRIYINGPSHFIQVNQIKKDEIKNKYCSENYIKLIRFWEYDILNKPEEIKCKLKELLL